MEEGQALAYKQSEMEKSVRKARGSLRGVTEERDALAKVKESWRHGVVVFCAAGYAEDDDLFPPVGGGSQHVLSQHAEYHVLLLAGECVILSTCFCLWCVLSPTDFWHFVLRSVRVRVRVRVQPTSIMRSR